jgi:hypothetical protein
VWRKAQLYHHSHTHLYALHRDNCTFTVSVVSATPTWEFLRHSCKYYLLWVVKPYKKYSEFSCNVCCCCRILAKRGMFQKNCTRPNVKNYDNMFSSSHVVTYGQTDRHGENSWRILAIF